MYKYSCSESTTLRESMLIVNDNTKGFICIVDRNRKLLGVLTDGDIRRAIIDGANLDESALKFANRKPLSENIKTSRDDIRKKISSMIKFIPIVDDENVLVDVVTSNDIQFMPIASPKMIGNEITYALDALLSNWISSKGEYVTRFENEFAKFCGVKHAVAVSNGTVAIHLSLVALGIGPGDEVIVPSLTFAATINAVLHAGATPVIVDVDDTWTIDSQKISEAITENTKAIIPVHLYGQPCQMGDILELAEKRNIQVIEDCAEAHGASFNDELVGSIGKCGTFSFFANKIITTGEGGMITTNSEELNNKLRVLRDHGMSTKKRYWHDEVGFNYRMTNIQAAIGCGQLEKIEEILTKRHELEEVFRSQNKNCELLSLQRGDYQSRKKVNWLISFLLKDEVGHLRDELIEYLYEKGIETRPFFYSLEEMPLYSKYSKGACQVSRKLSTLGISVPTDINHNENDVDKFYNHVNNFFNERL